MSSLLHSKVSGFRMLSLWMHLLSLDSSFWNTGMHFPAVAAKHKTTTSSKVYKGLAHLCKSVCCDKVCNMKWASPNISSTSFWDQSHFEDRVFFLSEQHRGRAVSFHFSGNRPNFFQGSHKVPGLRTIVDGFTGLVLCRIKCPMNLCGEFQSTTLLLMSRPEQMLVCPFLCAISYGPDQQQEAEP